jgi:hypothetical protein
LRVHTPGHIFGPGRARKKLDAKKCRPSPTIGPEISAQAWPMEAIFCQAIGPGLPKIFHFSCLGQAQLGYRADICCPGPTRLHVLARRAGPFFGPGRAGLPMPRLACTFGYSMSIYKFSEKKSIFLACVETIIFYLQ